jgi:hypothetical protein
VAGGSRRLAVACGRRATVRSCAPRSRCVTRCSRSW